MYDSNFSPEQIERFLDAPSGDDVRLMYELQVLYQPLANDHARSLERVWVCLVQQEALGGASLVAQRERPEGKIITIKGKKCHGR